MLEFINHSENTFKLGRVNVLTVCLVVNKTNFRNKSSFEGKTSKVYFEIYIYICYSR